MNQIDFENSYLRKFDFNSLYISECNEEAIQAALQFVTASEKAATIFAVWGSVGNGKTHLIGAACNDIKRLRTGTKILVATLDGFEALDADCDILILDSADILLKTGNLKVATILGLLDSGVSVLISSAIKPSDYLPGLFTGSVSTSLECEIKTPSIQNLIRFAEHLGRPSAIDQFNKSSLTSFREVEANVVRSIIRSELQH